MLGQMQVVITPVDVSCSLHPSPYTIGPIEQAHLRIQQAILSDGKEITLLIPTDISSVVLVDPDCRGAE